MRLISTWRRRCCRRSSRCVILSATSGSPAPGQSVIAQLCGLEQLTYRPILPRGRERRGRVVAIAVAATSVLMAATDAPGDDKHAPLAPKVLHFTVTVEGSLHNVETRSGSG